MIRRKGMMVITEHLLTLLFIVIVIIGMIVLLSGYQAGRLALERQKTLSGTAFSQALFLLTTPALTNGHSLYDDTKLTAAKKNAEAVCAAIERQTGLSWFLVIETSGSGECTAAYNPSCGRWSLCERDERNVSYLFPANVVRRFASPAGRTDFATVRAGVYQ